MAQRLQAQPRLGVVSFRRILSGGWCCASAGLESGRVLPHQSFTPAYRPLSTETFLW